MPSFCSGGDFSMNGMRMTGDSHLRSSIVRFGVSGDGGGYLDPAYTGRGYGGTSAGNANGS